MKKILVLEDEENIRSFVVINLKRAGYEVVGAVTQPDRPVGRKGKLTPPPVKVCAQQHGIPVLQFERIRRPEGREALEALKPDLFVTAAFGQILSAKVLAIPKLGTINVHASLLPKYRGASPIQSAVLAGERVTGVSTMYLAEGMDEGDVIEIRKTPIEPYENAQSLLNRLASIGAELLCDTLASVAAGTLLFRTCSPASSVSTSAAACASTRLSARTVSVSTALALSLRE